MRHYTCDKSGEKHLTESETTTLRLRGPLASMIDRKELHISKDVARELANWLGFPQPDPSDPFLFNVQRQAEQPAAKRTPKKGAR